MISTGVLAMPATTNGTSAVLQRKSTLRGVPCARVKSIKATKKSQAKGGALMTKCCGVLAVFDYSKTEETPSSCSESVVRSLCDRMGPRGPDGQGYGSGVSSTGDWHWALGHQRLSIMDPTDAGNQPFVKPDLSVAANGEIYNFRALYDTLPEPVETVSDSDSEVLMHLYRAFGHKFVPELDGMFAFVLVDQEKGTFLAARDPCGIKPLYMGRSKGADGGKLMFASELKCLVDVCDEIEEFPAGTYYTPETGYVNYYQPEFMKEGFEHNPNITAKEIRDELEMAVVKRMMSDVEFGMFLSGGIDSCIVGTLMRPHVPESKRLPSFCVGMKDSPDITAAREIAGVLKYDHHERIFTADEACSIIDKVIYHLETYNAELIRSSIPNYFLAEFASQQVKMCLTGEGSDELFGGYVYFADAPDTDQFQSELNRIYGALGGVNLKRADRMTMAHGLEARVPFLDVRFTAKAMSLDPKYKMIGKTKETREKAYLRNMFKGEIPEEILWRQKAMQCEGVGEGWVAQLQRYCESKVSDTAFANAATRFPYDTPETKEEYYYRDVFESYFPNLDKFTFVWPGGCRAGGAPWKSDRYTRAGLVDVSALSHGLQENSFRDVQARGPTDPTTAARAFRSPTKSSDWSSIFAGKNGGVTGVSRAPDMRAKASAAPVSTSSDEKTTIYPNPEGINTWPSLEEVLLMGSDERSELDEHGRNSYHVGPYRVPGHLVRSSCTCNPLTTLGAQGAKTWYPVVMSAWPMEFGNIMENHVRARLQAMLQLPPGTGIITAPSGTDIELIPIIVAKSLFPESKQIRMMVSAMNEIGRGVGAAAGGEFSSQISPASSLGGSNLTTEDITSMLKTTQLDARDAEGNYLDHSATIAAEVAAGDAAGEPVIVHTVYGTKTNYREPFPAGTACEAPEAKNFVVADACQCRYSVAEMHALLEQGAMVTITGSKSWCGPPFSGAIIIPAPLMERLQRLDAKDVWMPDMLNHYFTRHDFPLSLPTFRMHLPLLENRGLALRWMAALEEAEAYFKAGGDSQECRDQVDRWSAAVSQEMAGAHPLCEVFEINDSTINFKVKPSEGGAWMTADELRKLYGLLAVDCTAQLEAAGVALSAEEKALAATKCHIGQPVKICDTFGIIRLALGANDMRSLIEDCSVTALARVDATILRKVSLLAEHSAVYL
jgi:asparagine synthase (glutamine-hydrolysing)